jgi:hypothetical protein
LSRASTSWLHLSEKDVDGRDKPGHDEKSDSFSVTSERLKMLDAFSVRLSGMRAPNPHGEERGNAARLEP